MTSVQPAADLGVRPIAEVRTRAAVVFMLLTAGLGAAALALPDGYIRDAWRPAMVALCAIVGVASGLLLLGGRWARLDAPVIIGLGNPALIVGHASLQDRMTGEVTAALLSLPTAFVALFLPVRWFVVQGVVVTVCGAVMTTIAGLPPAAAVIHTLTVLIASVGPGLAVKAVRNRLDVAMAEARALAVTDPLTGLLNRRGMSERVPAQVARARRAGGLLAVLVADVDHFKQINDAHGHAAGDRVLRQVADTLCGTARPDDLCVRLGGEELALVAVLAGPEEVRPLAERLRSAVARSADLPVTVSIGAAAASPADPGDAGDGDDPDSLVGRLVRAADDAMYDAKRAGRDRVVLAPPGSLPG